MHYIPKFAVFTNVVDNYQSFTSGNQQSQIIFHKVEERGEFQICHIHKSDPLYNTLLVSTFTLKWPLNYFHLQSFTSSNQQSQIIFHKVEERGEFKILDRLNFIYPKVTPILL